MKKINMKEWLIKNKEIVIPVSAMVIGGIFGLGLGIGSWFNFEHYVEIVDEVNHKKINVDFVEEDLKEIKSIGVGNGNWLELYDNEGKTILSKGETLDWKTYLSGREKHWNFEWCKYLFSIW
ncbi:MAG: hypothetical protein ACRC4M_04310 [Mycoplasma sp.]